MGNTEYSLHAIKESLLFINKINIDRRPLSDYDKYRTDSIVSSLNVREQKTLLLELEKIQNRNNSEEYAYNRLRRGYIIR